MKTNLFVCIFAGFFLCLGLLVPASYADTTVLLNTVDVQRHANVPADNLVGNKKAVADPVEGRGDGKTKDSQPSVGSEGAKETCLEVEISIFSGRRDPLFYISAEKELKQMQDLISGLEKYERRDYVSRREYSKLGYNGFFVRIVGESAIFPGICEIYVYKNYVEIISHKRIGIGKEKDVNFLDSRAHDEKEIRFDRNRAVEDFLFKLAMDRKLLDAKEGEFYKNAK